jgi:hypothetical protein
MATHIFITVLQPLLSPEGLCNETLTRLDWIELSHILLFGDCLDFNPIMPWMALPDNPEAWGEVSLFVLCMI